ncbi:ABC transporter permease [Vibrio maerlii]|uniref:ABC transporter permease n=1 Tax=Vibrio maerlii TaxID=2231648 RepID=UPI000E3CDC33|nr:ABC transporter permease [Vibrio maerlii]
MSNAFSTQWKIFINDRWLIICLTIMPILLAVIIGSIFSAGTARDLPIGVVDLSHSAMSRTLSQSLDASATLKVSQSYSSLHDAKNAMIESHIYGVVVIPKHLDRDVYLGQTPQIDVFYNSQFILVGKLLNSAIQQTIGTMSAQIGVAKELTSGDTALDGAKGQAVVVQTQISPLFNQTTNYAQFLVSAIVPALWQVFIVVGTILILNANLKQSNLNQWIGTAPLTSISKTLSPYIPIFMTMGIGFLIWFYHVEQWLFSGDYLIVLLAQLLTTLACMIMGSLFFFLTLDPARAMSFAGAFTAPSFAFMGITFPTSDMGMLAQTWRSLLPISHYIEVQVSQSSYGVTMWQSILSLAPMCLYLTVLIPIVLLIKKHKGKAAI